MANVSIARRYARALIDVGAESKKLDAFGEQLERFASALSASKALSEVMSQYERDFGPEKRAHLVLELSHT